MFTCQIHQGLEWREFPEVEKISGIQLLLFQHHFCNIHMQNQLRFDNNNQQVYIVEEVIFYYTTET